MINEEYHLRCPNCNGEFFNERWGYSVRCIDCGERYFNEQVWIAENFATSKRRVLRVK